MITIISGTNRSGSKTLQIAKHYQKILTELDVNHKLLQLTEIETITRSEKFIAIEQQFINPAEKFIFIIPEYNGSFPGILKLMFDNSDIRNAWYHKKALITGVADGRAGNLRGIDHLTNILNYLKVNVFHHKLPISRINEEIDADGNWKNVITPNIIKEQITSFLKF